MKDNWRSYCRVTLGIEFFFPRRLFFCPRKDSGPSLLSSLSLSSSSPSPAFYSEAKSASSGGLLNGPLSYSQSSDIIKVRRRPRQYVGKLHPPVPLKPVLW